MAELFQFVRPLPVWEQLDADIQAMKASFDGPISAYAIVTFDRDRGYNAAFVAGQFDDIAEEVYDVLVETINEPEETEIEIVLEPSNANSITGALIDRGIIRDDE
jgi:hypothetical protein